MMASKTARIGDGGRNLDQPLLTIADVARLTGFSEKTVRRWIDSRRLVARKFGSHWRIHPVDYAAFINEGLSSWRQSTMSR